MKGINRIVVALLVFFLVSNIYLEYLAEALYRVAGARSLDIPVTLLLGLCMGYFLWKKEGKAGGVFVPQVFIILVILYLFLSTHLVSHQMILIECGLAGAAVALLRPRSDWVVLGILSAFILFMEMIQALFTMERFFVMDLLRSSVVSLGGFLLAGKGKRGRNPRRR